MKWGCRPRASLVPRSAWVSPPFRRRAGRRMSAGLRSIPRRPFTYREIVRPIVASEAPTARQRIRFAPRCILGTSGMSWSSTFALLLPAGCHTGLRTVWRGLGPPFPGGQVTWLDNTNGVTIGSPSRRRPSSSRPVRVGARSALEPWRRRDGKTADSSVDGRRCLHLFSWMRGPCRGLPGGCVDGRHG